jgi:nucleoside-diphosphate-sugar epimerase
MLRLAGLFSPGARESVEMMYEFTEPFEVDSNRMQRTFGLEPTPVDVALRRTMEWYRTSASWS